MAEDSNNPSLNSGITPTRLGRNQTSWRSTLHVFLPNGEFLSVKFGDNSELKVSQSVFYQKHVLEVLIKSER